MFDESGDEHRNAYHRRAEQQHAYILHNERRNVKIAEHSENERIKDIDERTEKEQAERADEL